jgi:NAD(P)-dependent dehydrogenase (short-subunit alcohol dehydrogenase family)
VGAEGASVVVHFNSAPSQAAAEETVKAVKAAGGDAFAIQGDFTKVAEVVNVFEEAKKRYGGIDIAVNTAGKVLKKPIVDTTEEEYDTRSCRCHSGACLPNEEICRLRIHGEHRVHGN